MLVLAFVQTKRGLSLRAGAHFQCGMVVANEALWKSQAIMNQEELFMRGHTTCQRVTAVLIFVLALTLTGAAAQTNAQGRSNSRDVGYSESNDSTRARVAKSESETEPAKILRGAHTIFVKPNEYIDAEYLEYKLDKYPEFEQWHLAFVKNAEKADLVIEVHRTALNYIFSVIEPQSSIVVAKGKVVAINGLVAAEDIAQVIIKRMKNTRALPTNEQ
jgi:hypothetical protein